MKTAVIILLTLMKVAVEADVYKTCQPGDFHYEFTECDESGGRWRVSVPEPGKCDGGAPNPPTRGDCSVSCDPGYYFNVTRLECDKCPPGTYSLGGGVSFDSWDELPRGFHSSTEPFRSAFGIGRRRGDVACSQYGWQPRGDMLASKGGPCAAVLVYTVKLVKPGSLSYTYQYTDENIIFEFQAQNEQCQSIDDADDYKYPPLTGDGKWKTLTVELKMGLNVLHWKTIDIDAHSSRPVLIKSIKISGVAYTSECTACPGGTFSSEGAQACEKCPKDSYSLKGASECIDCNPKIEYAPPGSPKCLTRPACTPHDYYEIDSACDSNNKTRAMYKWVEPQVCREEAEGSVSLPPSGEQKTCPPCNPGMHYTNASGCAFCPRDEHSDGMSACRPCPPSTAPNYGYQYQWWASMPPSMTATCLPTDASGCSTSDGWQPAGDHIHSGHGHADDAFLVLSLKVGGFRGREGFVNGRPMEVGRISFTFELACISQCEFVFMEGSSKKGGTFLQSWKGRKQRFYYSYIVTRNDSYTFSWAFQKVSWEKSYKRPGSMRMYDDDMAKIYNINVTNTIDGGASSCLPCPQGLEGPGCIPCPAGQYIEKNTTECTPCPPNTVVTDPLPYGPESCIECGPGLTSPDHLTCLAECHLEVEGATYDLRNISKARAVVSSTLFTSSGAKYFHMFNISLCGDSVVTCTNNVSYNMEGANTQVTSRICRSTIVPGLDTGGLGLGPPGSGGRTGALSTQSVSLGDHLLAVSNESSIMGIEVIEEFVDPDQKDLHFFYTSPSITHPCPSGRTTTVTLRCAPEESGQGQVSLPVQCPDGTCDGCNFHFLWSTPLACPQCSRNDLIVVKGECVGGKQEVHYIAPKSCRAPSRLPEGRTLPCSAQLPFIVEMIVLSAVGVALLLCLLLYCLWKKNQHLEYKYMKLVASAYSKDGTMELPPAESCALDDGEEEEIQFSQNKKSLLGYPK